MGHWLEMGQSILSMNVDISIVFIHRITQFYLHGENISFSNYFHQHFLGDKGNKCLNLQTVQGTRNQ